MIAWRFGAIAQLVERVLCKHEVVGSNPSGSTIFRPPFGGLHVILTTSLTGFLAFRGSGVGIDIVNEGFARPFPGLVPGIWGFRADFVEDIV